MFRRVDFIQNSEIQNETNSNCDRTTQRIKMRLTILLPLATLTSSLVFFTNTLGQDVVEKRDFTLFESLGGNSSSNVPGRFGNGERVSRTAQSSPSFVLIGTSRIGSTRIATLKHLSGEVVRVPLGEESMPIPGYGNYSVINHRAAQVAILYPSSMPCNSFPELGVSCDTDTNTSWLSLVTAAAIIREPQELDQPNADAGEVDAGEIAPEQNNTSRNPFAALRDREAIDVAGQAAPENRQLPRRIAPEDVPPGMRVVSTPFGDRLVQE